MGAGAGPSLPGKAMVHISFQPHVLCSHLGCLKLATVGGFTTWPSANATESGVFGEPVVKHLQHTASWGVDVQKDFL